MSTALEQAKQTIEAVKQGKVLEPKMALRLATALAQVAQAEAAEKRNEIALMALDPWAAFKAKDGEIARLAQVNKDLLAAAKIDTDWIVKAQGVLDGVKGYGGLPEDLLDAADELLNFVW